jgi:hypothetical protein
LGQQDNGEIHNSIVEIKRYLLGSNPEPMASKEFQEFWMSLSEKEKDEYRTTELK